MVFSSNELDMLVLQNGEDGISADSKYIWVKYSQNANGVPLTDNPTGAVYIGIAYNKDSIEESNNPDDYSWSKILGDKGEDAYTIILSNENISFSVSYEDNLAIGDQSFTTDVRVFYGATERDDFVIGEIGSSNGITVSKTVNSVTLSVTDNTKITVKHGYFRIPISIDGMIFYKDMSWNTVSQGAPGSVGQPALNVSLGNESQNIPCNSEGVTLENFLIEIPFAAYEGFNKVGCTASVGVLPSGITLGQNTGSTPDADGLIILNVARGSNLGGGEVLQGKVVITFIIGESEVIKNFTWTKTKDGANGEAGQFTLYSLESSAPVISKTFDDTFSPESITFSAYSMEGNSGDKVEYSGMFIIEESTNGTIYDTSYLSSADEQSVTFTPTSINVISIRCTLYKAGGITSALDIYTVPVLTDVDNMRPIIDEITTSISGVESKVDSVEKSITDKVWQTDITTQINNYDNTTTKIIRDRVTQVEQDIDGITSSVSDIESSFNGDIQELTTKISQVEQDANGLKTTVEQSYAKKDDLENEATSIRSEISQTASEINQSISDLEGNTSKLSQDISSLTARVTNTEGDVAELQQTASGIETTVKNNSGDIATLKQTAQGLQSDVTTVQADVGKLETSVSQNAKEIELVSSKTEEIGEKADATATNLANNYYSKTETDAKIKVESDRITSTVSKVETVEKSSITSTVEQFYLSTSPTALSGGSWSTTQPTWTQGKYIWRRTLVTKGDGTQSYTPNSTGVCITGNTGATGAPGQDGADGTSVTVSSTSVTYQISDSGTTKPTGEWLEAVPTVPAGKYLWTKTVVNYSDGKSTESYSISRSGVDGSNGSSVTITKQEVTYQASSSGTTTPSGTWLTTVPSVSPGQYLWTKTVITYSDGKSTTAYSVARQGQDGADGQDGKDGASLYTWVKYADNASGDGISDSPAGKEYIGFAYNKTTPIENNTPGDYTWSLIKGADGQDGSDGSPGKDGIGIESSSVTYQASYSGTSIPTGNWSTSIPAVSAGQYLWTKTVITFSNGQSETAYSVGRMGQNGANGSNGTDGIGIESTAVTYQAGASQTTAPTGSWTNIVPKLTTALPYLWTRTVITYTDDSTSTSYSVSSTLDGIEIGGRNLIIAATCLFQTWYGSDNTIATLSNVYATDYISIDSSSEYTLSGFEVTTPSGPYSRINTFTEDKVFIESIANNDGFPQTYKFDSNVAYVRISIKNDGGTYSNSHKFEKGNKATDWTPAPEDMATTGDIENVQESITGIDERVTESESEIEQLANSISMMVTDENGQSLMEQTSEGWTFNIGAIQSQIDEATAGLDTVEKNLNSTTDMVNKTNDLLDDVTQKTAYINMATDDSGAPCIELGKQGNPFKLRITNTSIDFMQDNMRIAYITNRQLYIEKSVVTDEMKVGSTSGFIWKKRANGNMGLRWEDE